jgi:hypothetical protein
VSGPGSSGAPRAVWRVSYVARPGERADVGGSSEPPGGAFVNAYVVSEAPDQADDLARAGLEQAGWWVEEAQAPEALDLRALEGEEVDLVEQARVDGAVWVFHTWPLGAEDDPGPVPG